jgi:flavin-dependent dehydrogenase
VNPGAVAVLERLGLRGALDGALLRGWRLRTEDADVAADFGPGVHGLGISRLALDAALLDAARSAGARVEEGTRVVAVGAARGGRPSVEIRGAPTLRPAMVVGADGLRSVVVRSLGLLARRPRLVKLSLTTHVRMGSGPGPSPALPVGRGLLHVADGVTLGVAPVGGGWWNVTVVADPRVHGSSASVDPAGFVLSVLRRRLPGIEVEDAAAAGSGSRARDGRGSPDGTGDGAAPLASGPFDWPVRRSWAPGVVLVGDAAGYFDPFTGQGIYRALRTAELAADAVLRALDEGDARRPLAAYHRRWRRESRWSRLVQRGVEWVMASPQARGRVLRRLSAAGGLDTVIGVTGDVASPATLLDPRLWLGRAAA